MKSKIMWITFDLVAALVVFTGCDMATEHTTITTNEAIYMMANQNVVIVDVRTPAEFSSGHIPGAISLELNEIRYMVNFVILDVNQTILVYCRSGVRSAEASAILAEMGYRNVYDFGGILSWTGDIQY